MNDLSLSSATAMPREPTVCEGTEVKIQECPVVLQVRWVCFIEPRMSFMVYIYVRILVPAVLTGLSIIHISMCMHFINIYIRRLLQK